MSAIEITKTKEKVRYYLEKYPHLRDSDEKLIASIWKTELIKKSDKPAEATAVAFLQQYAQGWYTNPESIRRSRQKLQEEHEHLRGENYGGRHGNQDNIKDQLR